MQVGYVKIAFFEQLRSLQLICFIAENLCPSATVVHVHDSELAEEYTVHQQLWSSTKFVYSMYGSLQR